MDDLIDKVLRVLAKMAGEKGFSGVVGLRRSLRARRQIQTPLSRDFRITNRQTAAALGKIAVCFQVAKKYVVAIVALVGSIKRRGDSEWKGDAPDVCRSGSERRPVLVRMLRVASVAALILAAAGCGRRHHNSSVDEELSEPPTAEQRAKAGAPGFLTYAQVERLRLVHHTFADALPRPIEAWADDIRGSPDPEAALRAWEAKATAYETFTIIKTNKPLSLEAKREVMRVLQCRERFSEEVVFKKLPLTYLTKSNVMEILDYYAAAEPDLPK